MKIKKGNKVLCIVESRDTIISIKHENREQIRTFLTIWSGEVIEVYSKLIKIYNKYSHTVALITPDKVFILPDEVDSVKEREVIDKVLKEVNNLNKERLEKLNHEIIEEFGMDE
jgi:bifunctional DNA-binding transcriptional regulator/antitoxin component of YhaV-PrlF toxin-antitoxin module